MSSDPEPATAPARDLADEAAATPDGALTAALASAQGAFPRIERKNTAEVRGKDGKPGYSYTYADLGDVLGAVRPVLAEHGLAIVQRTVRGERGVILLTELRHVGGGILTTEVDLGQASTNPQAFGGALTYLRRYELVTLLGIAAEEDRDAQDVPVNGGRAPAPTLPGWARVATPQEAGKAREGLLALFRHEGTVDEYLARLAGGTDDALTFAAAAAVANVRDWAKLARDRLAGEQRAAQDRDAEAPDAPAPEEVDAEPDEEPPPGVGANLDDEDAPAGVGTEDAPAPGTVTVDARADGETLVAYVRRLRAAGCICPQPVGTDEVDEARADACPVREHGIPF